MHEPSTLRELTVLTGRWSWWLPASVFLFFAVILIWLGIASVRTESRQLTLETRLTAEQLRLRTEDWIHARTAVVEHTRTLWVHEFRQDPEAFRAFATRMVELYQGFQALNWISADWVIEIVVPEESNRPALHADLHDHPSPGVPQALTTAKTEDVIAATGKIDLLQGGTGLTTYRAVRTDDGTLLGFVNGVFRLDTLIDTIAADEALRQRFQVALLDHTGHLAITQTGAGEPDAWSRAIDTPVQIADRRWTMRVAPSSQRIVGGRATRAAVLAGIGLLLAAVLSLAVRGLVQRQQLLEESEAKYRLLVENQRDMVVKVSADGRFLFASPSYCDTFGIAESELLGREYMPLVHPDDREATARAVASLQYPPHTIDIEQRALTRNGWRWLAWVDTALVDDAGNVTEIIGVGRDVTTRKRLEEQLRQSQKLQAIGQLAGGIAHDFNNILQTIVTNLEFALDELPTEHPVRTDLLEARTSADRAATLVRQLLTFSRQEPITPDDLDLDDVVRETLSMLRRLLGQRITVQFVPASNGTLVRCDSRQVEQILMNLCVNARDAGCSTITITTDVRVLTEEDCASLPWARPGQFVRLTISDDGHGMSRDVLDKVFEPFFTTKEVGEGTGLGLSTVYGIVEQHGGLIQVSSEAGAGALFDVYFPTVEPAGGVPSPADPERSSASPGATILVVEDDAQLRTANKRVLERSGYHVVTASDGLEAVRLATTHSTTLELAILDLHMPGLDGVAACEEIRSAAPTIRVLFCSGIAGPVTAAGELPTLSKPFTHQQLLEAVHQALTT